MKYVTSAKRGFGRAFFIFSTIILSNFSPVLVELANAAETIEVWWPTDGRLMTGTSPIKAVLSGRSISDYNMTWNVDGGADVAMPDSYVDHPHKEYEINYSTWNWRGSGPYTITLTARNHSGTVLATKTISVSTGNTATTSSSTTTVTQNSVATTASSKNISIWWPTQDARVRGSLDIKAVLDDHNVANYKMYWQVNGGAKTEMPTNTSVWPHKESPADTTRWNSGNNSLKISANALDGTLLGEKTINVISENTQPVTTVVNPVVTNTTSNPLKNHQFFTGTYSPAAAQVESWKNTRPADAEAIKKLVGVQDARWFGGWNGNVENDVRDYVNQAANISTLPIIVAYNIPFRDCGGYSSGGADSANNYRAWIESFARGIGSNKAVVILEPDALPGVECLPENERNTRLDLLSHAVNILKNNSNTSVYIDAGHSNWISVSETASRLQRANIAKADGFSLNVSNYYTNAQNKVFGDAVSSAVGGKHYIVDTSRNGKGSNGEWCNPSGRAIGTMPTSNTDSPLIDAYLWIKKPGESDGYCNGGPAAGAWWGEYALGLVSN